MATETNNILGVMIISDELSRKFEEEDVATGPYFLGVTAETYVREYEGDFEFLVSLKDALHHYGYLTDRQVKGALNCIVADERRKVVAVQDDKPAKETIRVPAFGIYTVVLEDGTHVTIRVSEGTGNFEGKTIFAQLTGSDNESDYTGFGHANANDTLTLWASRQKQPGSPRRIAALQTLLEYDTNQQRSAGKAYAIESGNCYVCNRTLTTPESIAAGIGPVCRERQYI